MEVIDIAGYTTDEKISIARNYLEKDICKAYGIKPKKVFDISLTLLCMLVISLTIMEQELVYVAQNYNLFAV